MDRFAFFHPQIRNWFCQEVGTPTAVQHLAWPKIASGDHCLITAPTGSGKTFAAFLWAINCLLLNEDRRGKNNRILYISPLKALNQDVQCNLRDPLQSLRQCMAGQGHEITIGVRSGDTSHSERRLQDKYPPDIFITTPESLAILLSRPSFPALLSGIGTVIVDEIHNLADNKRGVMLMTLLTLLVEIGGEFQRIALSATLEPLEAVAHWFGASRYDAEQNLYIRRPVSIVRAPSDKQLQIELDRPKRGDGSLYNRLGPWLRDKISTQSSVLLFANSRRAVERTARLINEGELERLVYVHHGSLAKEIRQEVEQGFKQARFKAVLATHSLELGIDIGSVSRVILLSTPFSVSSARQRIGRSGHRVGEVASGLLVPFYELDLVYALIMSQMALEGAIEKSKLLDKPIDVLAQMVLVYLATGYSKAEEMLMSLRQLENFATLTKKELHQVLELLAGRLQGQRVMSLLARIHYDPQNGACTLRKHARMLLYRAGGVIADRGYFTLRNSVSGEKIGELDEEFVWERNIGDFFPFANRLWRLQRRDHQNVWVIPIDGQGGIVPFWRADATDRPPEFCRRVVDFFDRFERAEVFLLEPMDGLTISQDVADGIKCLLSEQIASWGTLPNLNRIVVESYNERAHAKGLADEQLLFTFRGGRFNRTLALTLAWSWRQSQQGDLNPLSNNEGILLRPPGQDFSIHRLLDQLKPEQVLTALQDCLKERSETAAVFRENSQIAMLIPRSFAGQRGPLWWRRQRSAQMMEELGQGQAHLLLQGCWQETLDRYYDPQEVMQWLRAWHEGQVEFCHSRLSQPSPMASDLIWQHQNEMMYLAEEGTPQSKPSLPALRDRYLEYGSLPFSAELLQQFFLEKWRLLQGMNPDSFEELKLWFHERRFVPRPIWEQMHQAVLAFADGAGPDVWAQFGAEAIPIKTAANEVIGFCDTKNLMELLLSPDDKDQKGSQLTFLLHWLRFFPLLTITELAQYWGWEEKDIRDLLEEASPETLFYHRSEERFGLQRILEQLWQRTRFERRLGLEPLNAISFSHFLYRWQTGDTGTQGSGHRLLDILCRFMIYPMQLSVWLKDFLPRLVPDFNQETLQRILDEHGILLGGDAHGRVSFYFPEDLNGFEPSDMGEASPEMTRIWQIFESSLGEINSHDLAQACEMGHTQVLACLKIFFFSGRIVCGQLDGLETVLGTEWATEREQVIQSRMKRSRRMAGTAGMSKISRGWRSLKFSQTFKSTPLEQLEEDKERVRLLLDRYGMLFPELLSHEHSKMKWNDLRSALSQMEWAGETISGYFVEGARSPQYLLPAAVEIFSNREAMAMRIIHCSEPSSLCGFGATLFRDTFPFAQNFGWLVLSESSWALAISENGRRVRLNPACAMAILTQALTLAMAWARQSKRFKNAGLWIIDEIDQQPVGDSGYRSLLMTVGFVAEMNELVLYPS